MGILHEELRTYGSDSDLNHLEQLFTYKKTALKNKKILAPRLDTDWWSIITKMDAYKVLSKLALACMTIFSGPLVEGSFNIMDDIITDDRSRLTVENYGALAHIKYTLKAAGVKSTNMKVTARTRRMCHAAYSTYTKHLEKKQIKQIWQQARIETNMQQ